MDGRRIPIFKKDAASPTIRGIKKPTGKPELTAYARDKDGHIHTYTDNDYKSKEDFRKDLKANELVSAQIKDKRDLYMLQHSNYTGMSEAYRELKRLKQQYEYSKRNNSGIADLWKSDIDVLKDKIDKANKVYLQKQKRYKMKK